MDKYANIDQLIDAIEKDTASEGFGFIKIDDENIANAICPSGMYKVALVFQSTGSNDYHWYRQNPDGTWSHKLPFVEPKNTDGASQVIYEPKYCNWNYTLNGKYYDTFVGYYAVYPLEIS